MLCSSNKSSTLPITTSAEVIRLAVMMYTRYPLSPGWVEDLLLEHSVEIRHEIARLSRNWVGQMFASEIRESHARFGAFPAGAIRRQE